MYLCKLDDGRSSEGGREHTPFWEFMVPAGLLQLLGRLEVMLVAHHKRPPMHTETALGPEVGVDLACLARVNMLVPHEPPRLVGSNWNEVQRDRAVALAKVLEDTAISGVATVEEAIAGSLHDERRPKCAVHVKEVASAPVLDRGPNNSQGLKTFFREFGFLPPVQFGYL